MSETPAPTVWPALQARDAHALIEFLVDVVGFEKTAVYEDGAMVAHAQLDWPEGGGIMMGSHKPGGEWSREPGTFGAYVVTDRVDALYEQVKGKGATFAEPTGAHSSQPTQEQWDEAIAAAEAALEAVRNEQ